MYLGGCSLPRHHGLHCLPATLASAADKHLALPFGHAPIRHWLIVGHRSSSELALLDRLGDATLRTACTPSHPSLRNRSYGGHPYPRVTRGLTARRTCGRMPLAPTTWPSSGR